MDAGHDAKIDSGKPDAGKPKIPSGWEGWEYLGNNDPCLVFRPLSLKDAVKPITWSATFPCPPNTACLRMDTPWTPWFEGGADQIYAEPLMRKVGSRKLFTVDIRIPRDLADPYDGGARYISSFYDLSKEGEPIVAFGATCGLVGFFSMWEDQAIYLYRSEPWNYHFFWDKIDKMAELKEPTISFSSEEIGHSMAELSLGDQFFAWRSGYLSKSDFKPLSNNIPSRIIKSPLAWGKHAFHRDETDFSYFEWVRHPDGSLEKLIQFPEGRIDGFDTDGEMMVWYQASDPTPGKESKELFDKWELWAAKYETNPSKIKPFRVAKLPHYKGKQGYLSQLTVHEGQIAIPGNPLRVYQIKDGSWRAVPAPDGKNFEYWRTVYVDNEEIFLWVKEYSKARTVMRFRLDALPLQPPDP